MWNVLWRGVVSRASCCVKGAVLCQGRRVVSRAPCCVKGAVLCQGRGVVSRAPYCVKGAVLCQAAREILTFWTRDYFFSFSTPCI